MRTLIISLILILYVPFVYSQETASTDTLVGLILNAKGKAIRNVPVYVPGKEVSVNTDRKGIFVIVENALPDTVTIILPSGNRFMIPVAGMKFLKIMTSETAFTAVPAKEEIINKIRRSNSTSGDFTVTGSDLRSTGEPDLIRAIAGKVPGLNLDYNNDGTISLRIRGGSSLEGNNEPLYVVDGSIVDDLRYINLNDIEKVDVLKDGSIYGTRGANGAIVVTTKN